MVMGGACVPCSRPADARNNASIIIAADVNTHFTCYPSPHPAAGYLPPFTFSELEIEILCANSMNCRRSTDAFLVFQPITSPHGVPVFRLRIIAAIPNKSANLAGALSGGCACTCFLLDQFGNYGEPYIKRRRLVSVRKIPPDPIYRI